MVSMELDLHPAICWFNQGSVIVYPLTAELVDVVDEAASEPRMLAVETSKTASTDRETTRWGS
jgi:hypothetical protein